MPVELWRADGLPGPSPDAIVVETAGIRIELPHELTLETVAEIRRLMEMTEALAERCAQLEEALESRVLIEQAKGVLVERYRIDPEAAFQVLRQSARSNRMRIHELAATVVSSPVTPRELAGVVRNGDAA